jgi:hypothetical protein
MFEFYLKFLEFFYLIINIKEVNTRTRTLKRINILNI